MKVFRLREEDTFPSHFFHGTRPGFAIFVMCRNVHRNVDYTSFDFIHFLSPFPHHICSMANFQINILRNTKASYLNQIEFSSKHFFPVTVDYLRWAFDCCFPFREQGIIKKIYPENLKKIMGAVRELPAKKHSQSSPIWVEMGWIGCAKEKSH